MFKPIAQNIKEQIIKICEKGPFLSEVKNVVVEWEENSGEAYKTFEVIF